MPAPSAPPPPNAYVARPDAKMRASGSAIERAVPPRVNRPDIAGAASSAPRGAADLEAAEALAPHAPWPFGLEAGLDERETCRRVISALRCACAFHDNVAVIALDPPAIVDRRQLSGKTVSKLTLTLRDGLLRSVALSFTDSTADATFAAP